MIQAIAARNIKLHDLKQKLGLQQIGDQDFFPEWFNDLPQLTDTEKQMLDRIKRNYLYLLEYSVMESIVKINKKTMNTSFDLKETDDGSYTFFSSEFEELFHSHSGAKQEAQKKFIEPCQLLKKAKIQKQIILLDICYGLGYNSAAALAGIWSVNPDCHIQLIALESNINVPRQAIQKKLLNLWQKPIPQWLEVLAFENQIKNDYLTANLYIDDARQTLQKLNLKNLKVDAIFLDPFSPPKCPQLWTVEFLKAVANCLKLEGYLATYSSAAAVRTALQLAGLKIGSTSGVGRRSPGTVASFQGTILPPLSLQEQEHLNTRAAIPYRDPTLNATKNIIIEQRQQEQENSLLEATSRWKKRWSN